jgi:hypothetical protein
MADTRAFARVSVALDCVAGPSSYRPASYSQFPFAESDEEQTEDEDEELECDPTPWDETALSDSTNEYFPSLDTSHDSDSQDRSWLDATSARVTSLESVHLPGVGVRVVSGCQDGSLWIFGSPRTPAQRVRSPTRPKYGSLTGLREPSSAPRRVSTSSHQSARTAILSQPRSASRARKASATVSLSGFDAFAGRPSSEFDLPPSPSYSIHVQADSEEENEQDDTASSQEEHVEGEDKFDPLVGCLLRPVPASIVKVLVVNDPESALDEGRVLLVLTSDG